LTRAFNPSEVAEHSLECNHETSMKEE